MEISPMVLVNIWTLCTLHMYLFLCGTGVVQCGPFFTDDLSRFDFSPKYKTHPMLYFDIMDVQAMRRRATTTHKHLAEELREAVRSIRQNRHMMPPEDYRSFGRVWNEVYGNNLPPLAMYYTLYPDEGLLQYIFTYMDRLTAYSSWYVESMPTDEVPVAHTLVGFVTTYDMIYGYLDSERRRKYTNKIIEVTLTLYKTAGERFWGNVYLQNHQSTNIVALLMGSLVSEMHSTNQMITRWKTFAVMKYERTLKLLEGIEDGSLNEGVGYVGYTVRSLTQYVYLAKRHLNFDHTAHPWLKKHFQYIYFTIVPGLQRTVGIADSPQTWFYGPESQLVFLDAFVLRDGTGNWLAAEVKKRKIAIMKQDRPHPQRYATLHTEFIFYDSDLAAKPPPGYDHQELHHFEDWGVVTYRSNSILNNMSTYLSFKSGKIHGEYINTIANTINDKTFSGWHSVNPGHEHADQNAFTLWMNGEPFISEGLYAPKHPFLDNVLMFRETRPDGHSRYTPCTYPWVGQLGTCNKWLQWIGQEEARAHGRILFAEERDHTVLIVGDNVNAYTQNLGLSNIFRSSLLVQDDIFIVVDHIIRTKDSKVSHVAAFFNNFMNNFIATRHSKSGFAGLSLDEDTRFKVFWTSIDGQSPNANISAHTHSAGGKPQSISNANITFKMSHEPSSTLLFVFAGVRADLQKFGVTKVSDGLQIHLHTASKKFHVKMALDMNELVDRPLCSVFEHNSGESTIFKKNANNAKAAGPILPMQPKEDIPSDDLHSNELGSDLSHQHRYAIFVLLLCASFVLLCLVFSKLSRRCHGMKGCRKIFIVGVIAALIFSVLIW